MAIVVFDRSDAPYLRWLQHNEGGYVLTTVRAISPQYMSLHRAHCRKISSYTKKMKKGAFTSRNYIKVCATSIASLANWIKVNGGSGFTKLCSTCAPEPMEFDLANADDNDLDDEQVASWEGARRLVFVNVFERSRRARENCIEHRGSRCVVCSFDFGEEYGHQFSGFIHVHHVVPLASVSAEYAVDPTTDLAPVCPNCHAMLHYGGKTRSLDELRKLRKKAASKRRDR